MNNDKIQKRLELIKSEGRLGLMTHVVVGYPTLKKSIELVGLMVELGVDFIELQMPFSDPMADGPTIMRANKIALENGAKTTDVFKVADLFKNSNTALLAMGYYNSVYNIGVEQYLQNAKKSGIAGMVIPDYPLHHEDVEKMHQLSEQCGIDQIKVISPASNAARIAENVNATQNILYYAGRKGITGVKSDLAQELEQNIAEVKQIGKQCNKPLSIAVGFGISTPEHVQSLKRVADIAVIGSKVLSEYDEGGLGAVNKFLNEIIAKLR